MKPCSSRSKLRLLALSWALAGCGGAPSPTSSDSKAPGGALSAHFAAGLPADAAATAVVSLAVFGPDVVPEVAAVEARVAGFVPPAELAAFAARARAASGAELLFVPAPVDANLPLDVEGIAGAAGEAGGAVRAARSVVFVRYAGKPLPDDAHLRAAVIAAAALAPDERHVIVDLGNRRVFDQAKWRAFLASDDWLAQQVVLDAEQGAPGTVTFFSRGMARFGLPDLEQAGVPEAEARARFERFQTMFQALRAHGPARVGDVIDGVKLAPCQRPAVAIERACVAM